LKEDEARELKQKLDSVFNQPTIITPWIQPVYPDWPNYPSWTITSSDGCKFNEGETPE